MGHLREGILRAFAGAGVRGQRAGTPNYDDLAVRVAAERDELSIVEDRLKPRFGVADAVFLVVNARG